MIAVQITVAIVAALSVSSSWALINLGNGLLVKDVMVISHAHRDSRYKTVSLMLDEYHLPHSRFMALPMHAPIDSIHSRLNKETKYTGTWDAHVAHWQNHLQVYFNISGRVRAGHEKDDPVLILQDDAFLPKASIALIEQAGQNLPADWEVFVLGYRNENCLDDFHNPTLCHVKMFLDTHAYIVRNAFVAEKLLQYGNTVERQNAELWWVPHLEKTFKFYLIRPAPVVHRISLEDQEKVMENAGTAVTATATATAISNERKVSLGKWGNVKEVIVINLDRRIERFNDLQVVLRNYSVAATRYSAVDSHTKREDQEYKFNPRTAYKNHVREGVTACWQSHLQVYFNISEKVTKYHEPDTPVLIFEDDVRFSSELFSQVESAANDLPNDWEVFVLGYKTDYCHTDEFYTDKVCMVKMFLDAQAYIIRNSTVAEKLISLDNTDSPGIADIWWLKYFLDKTLRFYMIRPKSMVCQLKAYGTDIQDADGFAGSKQGGCECCD